MEFKLDIKIEEGWYDEMDFKYTVQDACKKAIAGWVRGETIRILEEKYKDRSLALQRLLDAGLM